MVKASREVLADINEIDAAHIDTVLTAMAKWQKDVTLAITDMHTDDCVVWDANCNAIDEATQKFGEMCEASHIKHANAREARQKVVVAGDEKDPVIELLDWVLIKTRQVANKAMENFQKQFEEALVPRVPAEHLPILVSNAYNTVSQFRMTIWQMVADECIMPMRHDYLTNHGLASVMQHALEKVLSTCMRMVPPHPPESKDNLTLFLDSLGNSSATRSASHSSTSSYAHSPTSSYCSSSQYFRFGCEASTHDLHSGLRGSACCICSCRHVYRCVALPNFSVSTSCFQNAANKHPCDLHFLCSHCSIHTEGIYFWHCLAHFHSLNETPRWKIQLPDRCLPCRELGRSG